MKKIFCLFLFVSHFMANAQKSEPIYNGGLIFLHDASWQQVLDKAKKENKFILLDAYTTWCGPCKYMTTEIFPKPEVGTALNPSFVCAKFDMEKGEGLELARKYEVRSYPTYLFFDPNGELVHRVIGAMPAADFISVCKDALDSTKQYVTLRKKYLKGQRDSTFLREFAYVAMNAQDSLSKVSMMKYFQANNNQLNENTIQFLFALTGSLQDTSFNIMLNNKEDFYKVIGKDKVDETIEELVWNEAKRVGKKGTDTAAFRKVIQQYLPEETALLCSEYQLSLLIRSNNWKAYKPRAITFANTFCRNDADRLNDIAGRLLDNFGDKATLEKGLEFALRAVALKSNSDDNSTAAHLYAKLKNTGKAREYGQKALELAKQEGAETFELESFLKSLK